MKVSKTREKLIEVARQLFMKKGVENTTMNDIAAASEKGRRTIYTYFKSKKEIYNAVFEQQSEQLVDELCAIRDSDKSPLQKLSEYLMLRFTMIDKFTSKGDRMHLLFNREHKRIEKIMRMVQSKESTVLSDILSEGIKSGVFDQSRSVGFIALEQACAYGLDSVAYRDNLNAATGNIPELIKFLIDGLINTHNNILTNETT